MSIHICGFYTFTEGKTVSWIASRADIKLAKKRQWPMNKRRSRCALNLYVRLTVMKPMKFQKVVPSPKNEHRSLFHWDRPIAIHICRSQAQERVALVNSIAGTIAIHQTTRARKGKDSFYSTRGFFETRSDQIPIRGRVMIAEIVEER